MANARFINLPKYVVPAVVWTKLEAVERLYQRKPARCTSRNGAGKTILRGDTAERAVALASDPDPEPWLATRLLDVPHRCLNLTGRDLSSAPSDTGVRPSHAMLLVAAMREGSRRGQRSRSQTLRVASHKPNIRFDAGETHPVSPPLRRPQDAALIAVVAETACIKGGEPIPPLRSNPHTSSADPATKLDFSWKRCRAWICVRFDGSPVGERPRTQTFPRHSPGVDPAVLAKHRPESSAQVTVALSKRGRNPPSVKGPPRRATEYLHRQNARLCRHRDEGAQRRSRPFSTR